MTESFGNIVLFGETGAGKSSVINMIAGASVARVFNKTTVHAFQYHSYVLPLHGRNFTIFDTAGLDEGNTSSSGVHRAEAIAGLYKLIVGLNGGINLLMFCMRGPRIKSATHRNWKVFHDILCKGKVPIVLVVTGLENEEKMDDWWWENRGEFEDQGIRPDATACITAIRGKALGNGRHMFDEEYRESQAKVMAIINDKVRRRAIELEKIEWISTTTSYIFRLIPWSTTTQAAEIQHIVDMCGMSAEEAKKFKKQLISNEPHVRDIPTRPGTRNLNGGEMEANLLVLPPDFRW